MPTSPLASFQAYFADIEDPRVERTRRHELLDIIVLAICAVICGADPDLGVDSASDLVDHELAADHAGVFDALPAILAPDAIAVHHVVVCIAEQHERQVVLDLEPAMR